MASLGVLFWLFRDQRQPVHVTVETEVEDVYKRQGVGYRMIEEDAKPLEPAEETK